MRVPSVRAARRKLFKKPKSKFYWYDFMVRGRRYRASAQETEVSLSPANCEFETGFSNGTNRSTATKPVVPQDFANRFLDWVNDARLEEKARAFYRNGWRLLKSTSVTVLSVDQITGDCAEQLKFPGSPLMS